VPPISPSSSQFSHHAHAVDARELSLQLAQDLPFLFGALALSDVTRRAQEDEILRIALT
jgi:hypothetical protein